MRFFWVSSAVVLLVLVYILRAVSCHTHNDRALYYNAEPRPRFSAPLLYGSNPATFFNSPFYYNINPEVESENKSEEKSKETSEEKTEETSEETSEEISEEKEKCDKLRKGASCSEHLNVCFPDEYGKYFDAMMDNMDTIKPVMEDVGLGSTFGPERIPSWLWLRIGMPIPDDPTVLYKDYVKYKYGRFNMMDLQ